MEIRNHTSINSTLIKPNICFICVSKYHFIANYPKLDTLKNKVHWNTENPKTCAYISNKIEKTLDNSTDQNKSQKIYTSMTHISYNTESPRRDFGDRSQQTNSILESVTTCHMTPEISGFIPGSLVETDKYIEVSDGNFVLAKQIVEVQMKKMIVTANPLFIRYITYSLHQTFGIGYFTLLYQWIWYIPAFFVKVSTRFSVLIMNRTRWYYCIAHSKNMHSW